MTKKLSFDKVIFVKPSSDEQFWRAILRYKKKAIIRKKTFFWQYFFPCELKFSIHGYFSWFWKAKAIFWQKKCCFCQKNIAWSILLYLFIAILVVKIARLTRALLRMIFRTVWISYLCLYTQSQVAIQRLTSFPISSHFPEPLRPSLRRYLSWAP